MTHLRYCLLVLFLAVAGCGGGGASVDRPPVIRFIGTYDFACADCAPPRQNRLTLAPESGASGLGSREIVRVELSTDHGAPQVLVSPNSRNAAGQATYVFFFPRLNPVVGNIARVCTPPIPLEITVTDAGGLVFKKYFDACNAGEFGAFSDYGDKTVTYRAVTTPPMRASFSRGGMGGYIDSGSRGSGAASSVWTLKARDGDTLGAGLIFDAGVPDGSIATISIEAEGGAFASSAVARGTVADTFLACCGTGAKAQAPPSASTPDTQKISFIVVPTQFGVDVTKAVQTFKVYYRVFDPASNTVIAEFRGEGDGFSTWTFDVQPGYELTMEAAPQSSVTDIQAYISKGTGRGLDSPYMGNSLGIAQSNRPDVPAKLKVFCCAR
ncbi:MAG: hypothetical protein ABIV07_05260 [Polaromonas sp.]